MIITNPTRYSVDDDTTFILSYHLLLGFAVELYLKAYLTHRKHSEAELRRNDVRHNLEKLLALSEADGFNLLAAKRLVEYLHIKHGSFEYRYVRQGGRYDLRSQAEVFTDLDELDTYLDSEIGASASLGKKPTTGGWKVPDTYRGWRIPT